MGAAAPAIGSFIVSIVVSKAATEVAQAIGLNDTLSSVVGMAAAIYAGDYTYSEMSGATGTAGVGGVPPPSGPSLAPSANIGQSANALMEQGVDPGLAHAAAAAPPPTPPAPIQSGGTLSQAEALMGRQHNAPEGNQDSGTGSVSRQPIEVKQTDPRNPKSKSNWFDRLFSSDRLTDMGMAGVMGYASSENDASARREARAAEAARGQEWADRYGGNANRLAPSTTIAGG